MQNMEIEKKYTVKRLPEHLDSYSYKVIEQAYLNTKPVLRIRKSNDNYILTYKGNGLMARDEYNLPLDENSYKHLLEKADGTIVSKRRYLIPLNEPQFDNSFHPSSKTELVIELDVFEPPFAPLVIAEVEFPDIDMANAFIPPAWFDEDVTLNPAYHNATLSQKKFD